jgi:hypothetical protein
MESQLEWICLETWGKRPVVQRGTSWKGHKAQETRHRGETKVGKDKAKVRIGRKNHLVVEFSGKAITPDRVNSLREPNLEEVADKKGSKEGPPHTQSLQRQERQSIRGREKRAHSCSSLGASRKEKEMASSSSNKPTIEERLNSLEEDLQRIKNMLHYQLDFLQNLDIDAGRCLEILEADITTTKFGLTKELGKLRKELRDPKQEFENRVSNLEEKMKQLNKEWKTERDQSKKDDPK